MKKDIYCPTIHAGLTLDVKSNKLFVNPCCLQENASFEVDFREDIWNHKKLKIAREQNDNNIWDDKCNGCRLNEKSGLDSFRTSLIKEFGIKKNLSGPVRFDLMFTNNCNLACRSCNPAYSTYWQKHLIENNIKFKLNKVENGFDNIIKSIEKLDLSNLEVVGYCGGETLLGDEYWKMTEYLANNVPNAKKKLLISFQTNATMPVKEKYFPLIEKIRLVKFNFSLDAINNRFNYLRWPADWDQVVENIFNIRETAPVNVMFLVEETVSIFNLFYKKELKEWLEKNFSVNRLGDPVDHYMHLAFGHFSLTNLTDEYIDAMKDTNFINLIPRNFKENPESIKLMIAEIDKFDKIRGENWKKTFPEVAEFYKRYI